MKTLQFDTRLSLDDLSLVERPVPSPGSRQMVLRVRAVSLNYRDLAIARGTYGAYPLPLVPGSDAAGEVVQVGADVRRFAVGDAACLSYVPDWVDGPVRAETAQRRLGGPVPGVLSEYVVADESAVVRSPAHLTAIEASTLPIAGVTAWQALVTDAHVGPGEVVGVSGTGGVSLFAVQVAIMAGARVIVVGRDADKLGRAQTLGTSQGGTVNVVNASDTRWERRVLDLTAGRGVDCFVDVVGGDALARSIAATRIGGTVCAVGFVGGSDATVDLVALLRRAVTVRAASGGSRASFEALVQAVASHGVRPVVDRVFPFSIVGVRAAFGHLAEGRPFGKVVVDLDGAS